jgi:hypothetical protein
MKVIWSWCCHAFRVLAAVCECKPEGILKDVKINNTSLMCLYQYFSVSEGMRGVGEIGGVGTTALLEIEYRY